MKPSCGIGIGRGEWLGGGDGKRLTKDREDQQITRLFAQKRYQPTPLLSSFLFLFHAFHVNQ